MKFLISVQEACCQLAQRRSLQRSVPQRLKPHSNVDLYGTAEAVPLSKTAINQKMVGQKSMDAGELAGVESASGDLF
jgi:hypothetical protein